MALLSALLVAFGLVHILPSHPDVRQSLQRRFGAALGAAYGILSALLLVAMLWAYRHTPAAVLYDVPLWGRHANFILSLAGFICLGIFLFRGSWRAALRYPMALGVILWAAGHLLANGDEKSLVFFGGLAALAALQAVLLSVTDQRPPPVVRRGHNLLSVMGGLALYALATQLHQTLTGMPLVELR